VRRVGVNGQKRGDRRQEAGDRARRGAGAQGRNNSQPNHIRLMANDSSDLQQHVEGSDGIFVIRGSPVARSWNGIQYKIGMSSKNVPAKQLSMNVAVVPPGAVAFAHVHVGFEVMLYILQGRVRHEYGDGLKQSIDNAAGDFIYIEPGVPHEVFNLSDTEPVVAVVARSDAEEWAHIVTYDRTTGRLGDTLEP